MPDPSITYHRWPPTPRGGQHVRADTGVLAVHVPTGIAVACEDERSVYRNREEATRRLREVLERMAEQ